MTKAHAHLKWAELLINRAVELMSLEQLSQWEGVRTWQETNPIDHLTDELTEDLQENWQPIVAEHALYARTLQELKEGLENRVYHLQEVDNRLEETKGFIKVTIRFRGDDDGPSDWTWPLWAIHRQINDLQGDVVRYEMGVQSDLQRITSLEFEAAFPECACRTPPIGPGTPCNQCNPLESKSSDLDH